MRRVLSAIILSCCLVPQVYAQTAENVAVVINDASPASQKIGEYYAAKRAIPQSNIIRIRTSTDETISRAVYARTVEAPIAAALARGGLQDRVLYLVLTKGVPLRIDGTGEATGTVASVDSELTLLYRRATGVEVPVAGRMDNPFYVGAREPVQPPLFGHRDYDIYLVTRLDAFTVDEALALVDRALAPRTDGQVVLDLQDKLVNRTGEDWLEAAADRLKARGHADRVLLESTVKGVRDVSPVLGYYSWGSNDPRNRTRKFGLGFVAGSIAATFVSSDARTFREPPADWVPSGDSNRTTWFAGTPQSLTGDLIREGVTGVAGQVAEPYLQSTIRPEILFLLYLSGANLAEAFYGAMPHLSWQTVVIGDPLCGPFRKRPIDRAEIEGGIDSETRLPAYFSKRRGARIMAQAPGAPERAVVLSLRGEALMSRGDRAAARTAFEEATTLSSEMWQADLTLGLMYEQAGQGDEAIARYRRVIAVQPRSVVALNNLAYRLATEKKDLKDGLALATLAAKLAPDDDNVLDTLAWIQHLQGDGAAAIKTIAAALRAGTDNAEVRLHAAIINAAAGARAVAQDNLSEALRLNPALESSPEVKQVRQMLAK